MKRHTFSVRLPEDMVIEISQRALVSKRDRNAVVMELINLGLKGARDFEKAVHDFVFREVTAAEFKKLRSPE